MQINYNPIGIIHSPFSSAEGMPVQPAGATGIKGRIEIKKEFQDGLNDLEGFSYIFIIYHFHKSQSFNLKVIPFMDDKPRGIFATRAPKRPNQIGISVVKLTGIQENVLEIENVDVIDGTPLLDIKPYIPAFDIFKPGKCGWMDLTTLNLNEVKSDHRFSHQVK